MHKKIFLILTIIIFLLIGCNSSKTINSKEDFNKHIIGTWIWESGVDPSLTNLYFEMNSASEILWKWLIYEDGTIHWWIKSRTTSLDEDKPEDWNKIDWEANNKVNWWEDSSKDKEGNMMYIMHVKGWSPNFLNSSSEYEGLYRMLNSDEIINSYRGKTKTFKKISDKHIISENEFNTFGFTLDAREKIYKEFQTAKPLAHIDLRDSYPTITWETSVYTDKQIEYHTKIAEKYGLTYEELWELKKEGEYLGWDWFETYSFSYEKRLEIFNALMNCYERSCKDTWNSLPEDYVEINYKDLEDNQLFWLYDNFNDNSEFGQYRKIYDNGPKAYQISKENLDWDMVTSYTISADRDVFISAPNSNYSTFNKVKDDFFSSCQEKLLTDYNITNEQLRTIMANGYDNKWHLPNNKQCCWGWLREYQCPMCDCSLLNKNSYRTK